MTLSIKIELQIPTNSKILNTHKTIGDLKNTYKRLFFIKYIYLDPKDNKFKGANPPVELPLVANSYITIIGENDEIIQFTNDVVAI